MPWISSLIDRSVGEMSASAALLGRRWGLSVRTVWVWVGDRQNKTSENGEMEETISRGEKGVWESYSVIREQDSGSRHKHRAESGEQGQVQTGWASMCVYVCVCKNLGECTKQLGYF